MDEEIKKLLEEEIKTEIKDLSRLAIGSDEKSDAIEGLAKLYKLIIEETKIELDSIDKYESRNSDEQLKREQLSEQIKARDIEEKIKREQLNEQVKDRYFKLAVDAGICIGTLIFYSSWMKKGFKFEETGTYTSTTFRGLFGRFRPDK